MRISTSTLYNAGVAGMQRETQQLLKTQQQLSSGQRVLTPSDDPVAAAQALQVTQAQALNQGYATNAGSASDSLGLESNALASVIQLIQDVKVDAANAGDASLSHADRASLANDLRQKYQQLIGLANTIDGNGHYLFAGYRGTTQPFAQTASGAVAYSGDQGQRLLTVAPSTQIAVSDSGAAVFQEIPTGNGSFATQAASGNTGTGVIDSGTVVDPAKWNAPGNSGSYTIKFAVDSSVNPPQTTYDIVDNASGLSLLTGAPAAASGPYPGSYTSGAEIALGNIGGQVQIQGQPADGDSFTVQPSQKQDLFKTISDLANLLETSNGGAQLTNGLVTAQQNLDNALDSVSAVSASVGARQKAVSAATSAGQATALQYSQTLSRLQDLDYTAAISEFSQQQMALQAAQKSFAQLSGLSLFNYLGG